MSSTVNTERTAKARVRETVEYGRMIRAHRRIVDGMKPARRDAAPIRRVLILPADVADPAGSRGDDAMITAVIDRLGSVIPDAEIHVATLANSVAEVPRAHMVRLWEIPWRLDRVWDQVKEFDAQVVIGADVMDGYYSSVTSMRLWLLADLMARFRGGHRSKLVGFSFNTTPTWPVVRTIERHVGEQLRINLRDERSRRRFCAATGRDAALVADAAFMLEPQSIEGLPVAGWIRSQRAAGRVLGGLNIHPMLSAQRDVATLDRLVASAAAAVRRTVDEARCSWVMVPHDFRTDHGDVDMLRSVASLVDRPDHVVVAESPLVAAQIKALASALDVVVSGRMHLAIAALGSGVPAAGITYQGKFDGLFVDHFGLPEGLLLSAEGAEDENAMHDLIAGVVANRAELEEAVRQSWPQVARLASDNLGGLADTATTGNGQ